MAIGLNGGVTVVVVVVLAALVGVGGMGMVLRRVVDERRSVRDYHQTLDTLRRVGSTTPPAVERLAVAEPHLVIDPPDQPVPSAAPATAAGSDQPPTVVETASLRHPPAEPSTVVAALARRAGAGAGSGAAARMGVEVDPHPTEVLAPLAGGRARLAGGRVGEGIDGQMARDAASQRPRPFRRGRVPAPLRLATVLTAVAVVAVAGVTAYELTRPSSAGSARGPASAGGSVPSAAVGARRAGRSTSSQTGGTRKRGTSPAPVLAIASTSPTSGALPVTATTYTVTVSVTADCWVQGQDTSGTSASWSGVLTGGQQHVFSFDGPATLVLGAADASLSVDGKPVSLPSGYQVPFDLTLQPQG